MSTDDGFLARWSRRKTQLQRGEPMADAAAPAPAPVPPVAPAPPAVAAEAAAAPEVPAAVAENPDPPPTLQDVEALTPQADFSRFVKRDVDHGVKHAALKKLFADPHYNVMDGLDTYIGDYHTPDPLPPSMLRQMVQSQLLGLFTADPEPSATTALPATPDTALPAAASAAAPVEASALPAEPAPDEDPDLRLQPHDAAGRAGPVPGAGEDPGRQP